MTLKTCLDQLRLISYGMLCIDKNKEYSSFFKLKAEMCRIFEDSELCFKLSQIYATWQKKILKFAEGSKNIDVITIMKSMEVGLSNEGCDSDG